VLITIELGSHVNNSRAYPILKCLSEKGIMKVTLQYFGPRDINSAHIYKYSIDLVVGILTIANDFD
jgi:hypothetical protein